MKRILRSSGTAAGLLAGYFSWVGAQRGSFRAATVYYRPVLCCSGSVARRRRRVLHFFFFSFFLAGWLAGWLGTAKSRDWDWDSLRTDRLVPTAVLCCARL